MPSPAKNPSDSKTSSQNDVPEMVQEFTHKQLDLDNGVIDENNYLQIVESDIEYLLVNAIKEQQSIIDNQQNEIRAIKEQLKALTNILVNKEK